MRIFLSYRREDSSAWTGRLHDSLAHRFGDGNVFQDVEAVHPGEDFEDAVERAIAQSDAVLVVIGPAWSTAADVDGNRRLDAADDHVRAEIEVALRTGRRLIPILVGGATMPPAAQLPDAIRSLALRQAITLDDSSWRRTVDALIASLTGAGSSKRSVRRGAVAAVTAAAVVIVVVIAAGLLVRDSAGDADDDSADAPENNTDLEECEELSPSDWEPIDIEGAQRVTSDGWSVELVEAQRSDFGDGWRVLLRTSIRNGSSEERYFDHRYFAHLALDDLPFPIQCITYGVSGENLRPGRRAEPIVGYQFDREPTGPFALEVTPPEGELVTIEWG